MLFTTHGYAVSGTEEYDSPFPDEIRCCGGPNKRYNFVPCEECVLETVSIREALKHKDLKKQALVKEMAALQRDHELEDLDEKLARVDVLARESQKNLEQDLAKNSADASDALNKQFAKDREERNLSWLRLVMDPNHSEFQPTLAARAIVQQYFNTHAEKTDNVQITMDDVYIVWFAKTLQNWKALVSTTVSDGMYYEVTHDGDKNQTYLDAYKKFVNITYRDDEL